MKRNANLFFIYSIVLSFFWSFSELSAAQSVFADPSAGACADLAPTNTGTGTCTISSPTAFLQSENYTMTATSAGAGAAFSVTGSVSGPLTSISAGSTQTVYDVYGFPRFSVNLSNGGTPYAIGDNFRFAGTAGTELKKANFDLMTLTQICANGCSSGASLRVPDGSAGAPSLGSASNTGTGFRFSSSGANLDFVANGTDVGEVNTTAWSLSLNQIGIGTGLAASSPFIGVNTVTTGVVSIGGNPSPASGSSVKIYGSTHASKANLIEFYNNTILSLAVNAIGVASFPIQLIGKGTATNDSAAVGYIGEYIESVISTPTNIGASATWTNFTSVSLTAGDWEVSAAIHYDPSTASTTNTTCQMAISVNSGVTTTDHINGSNVVYFATTGASGQPRSGTIPSYRVSVAGTTTVYLKTNATYTVATPLLQGRLSARRIR